MTELMPKTADSNVTFVLRDKNAPEFTPIVAIIRFNNTRFKLATGYKVLPKYWNQNKHRVKSVVGAIDREMINAELIRIENAVKKAFDLIIANEETISKETFLPKIEILLNPKPKDGEPIKSKLFQFIDKFIENSPERINPNSGKKIEHKTIQKYKTVATLLKKFSMDYIRPIDFETIDLEFYYDFTKFLTNKNFSVNNIGKYIQTLKTFLNEATANGKNKKMEYKSPRFKVINENSDSIYLTEPELHQLFTYDFSKNKRLERTRDIFLIGAYTGLRFSDLTNLKPENIKNDFIRIEQIKTMEKVVIPCHPIVKKIISKYDGQLPKSVSNQKMNDYIKQACEIAGLTESVEKTITKGGIRKKNLFKKYELVSTHTARRSFATNMYLRKLPHITIMKVTGHQTEKAFLRYIKLTDEQHAQMMQEIWISQQLQFPIIEP